MGRASRIHFPGAVYHAMARGVDGRDIFADDHDRVAFVDALNHCADEAGAAILAYCLMGNHFHLAIRVGAVSLSGIIQRLLTGYSMAFNRRHDRTGHLFQARYKAIICLDDRYLTALIRYIHMNPVRAGVVSRPQDWPWSSFVYREGQDGSEFDRIDFDPWPNASDHDIGVLRIIDVDKQGIAAIGAEIALQTGVSVELLRSGNRRRIVIEAKRILTHEAVRRGHALGSVAAWLRVAPSTMTRYFGGSNAKTGRPDTIHGKK